MIKFKLKKDTTKLHPVVTADFWYDLIDGGYVNTDNYVESDQAAKVKEAIEVLYNFREFLRANDLIEDM